MKLRDGEILVLSWRGITVYGKPTMMQSGKRGFLARVETLAGDATWEAESMAEATMAVMAMASEWEGSGSLASPSPA